MTSSWQEKLDNELAEAESKSLKIDLATAAELASKQKAPSMPASVWIVVAFLPGEEKIAKGFDNAQDAAKFAKDAREKGASAAVVPGVMHPDAFNPGKALFLANKEFFENAEQITGKSQKLPR